MEHKHGGSFVLNIAVRSHENGLWKDARILANCYKEDSGVAGGKLFLTALVYILVNTEDLFYLIEDE